MKKRLSFTLQLFIGVLFACLTNTVNAQQAQNKRIVIPFLPPAVTTQIQTVPKFVPVTVISLMVVFKPDVSYGCFAFVEIYKLDGTPFGFAILNHLHGCTENMVVFGAEPGITLYAVITDAMGAIGISNMIDVGTEDIATTVYIQ